MRKIAGVINMNIWIIASYAVVYAKTEAERLENVIFIFMALDIPNIFPSSNSTFKIWYRQKKSITDLLCFFNFCSLFLYSLKMFSEKTKEWIVLESFFRQLRYLCIPGKLHFFFFLSSLKYITYYISDKEILIVFNNLCFLVVISRLIDLLLY